MVKLMYEGVRKLCEGTEKASWEDQSSAGDGSGDNSKGMISLQRGICEL